MGWTDGHISRLARGDTVQFRPRGNSMVGTIESGQLCMVEPVGAHVLAVGDIVVCRVKGAQYLHLIKAIQANAFRSAITAAVSRAGSRSARSSVS